MAEAFYDRDGITLFCGDNREILPELMKFDLLLTDPPYGIGEDGGQKSRYRKGDGRIKGIEKHAKHGWDKERPSEFVFDLLKESADIWMVFGGNYFADLLPVSSGWIYWDKNIGGDFSDGELIYTNQNRGLRSFKRHPFSGLRGGKDRVHPTQKPLSLMRWCIDQAGEIESVLDPFAGSGTTLLAAKLAGVRAVGIEINEQYCEAAVKRLAQGVLF